jgi:uncharacterized membrane protein SpoIIM required for sporulation
VRRPLFDKRWFILVLATFVLEVALFAVVSSISLSSAQVTSLINGTQGTLTQIDNAPFAYKVVDIFSNNMEIASLEFVPVFGWIRFVTVTYSTAQVISALASSYGVPAALLLIVTFLSPHSWIELMAYAVAVAESVLLAYAVPARRLHAELFRAVASVPLVILMLMFAAFLEAITVQYGTVQNDFTGFGYAWGVAIAVGLALYLLHRRLRPSRGVPVVAQPFPPPDVYVPSPSQDGPEGTSSA